MVYEISLGLPILMPNGQINADLVTGPHSFIDIVEEAIHSAL